MGEPVKAEKVAKHFATVTSPGLAAVPFGKRAVPTVPAVNFSNAILTAVKTYGNSAPLFLLQSKAVDPSGKVFVPMEAIFTNKVETSFATAHGHTGTLTLPNGVTLPAAINTGVLSGPEADCGAEIEALLYALADRAATEFKNDPLGFLNRFNSSADAAIVKALGEQAKGVGAWISGAYDWAVDKTSQAIEYVADGGARRDLGRAADYLGSGQVFGDIKDGAVAAYEWTAEAIDTLRNLDYDQLKEAFVDWLRETIGELKCDARDALAAMLADKRPMSEQLGEMYGTAKLAVAEAAAAVAVDVLVSKGAASAATRMGALVAKAGPRLAKLGDKLGDLLKRARRKPNKPDATPPKPKPHPDADKPKPKPDDKDKVKKDADGNGDRPCLLCPIKGEPVNTIFGCKILGDEKDLDFVFDAPLPLVWQRNYASSNAHESWLGQGWSLPLDFRLEVEAEALVVIETHGRRIRFPMLATGDEFLSLYEQMTLRRRERNVCELVMSDGLCLVFGLAPRQWMLLADRDDDEQRQSEQFDRALEALRVAGRLDSAVLSPTRDRRPPQADRLVLLGIADKNDNWLRVHYTADDLPQVIETSGGRHVGLHFDLQRRTTIVPRLLRVTELLGEPDAQGAFSASRQLVEYRYSDSDDLVAVIDANGEEVRTFAWSNHMLVEHAEPGGLVSRYEWDQLAPHGRVTVNTLSTGDSLRFTYDPLARENRVTDASGRTTIYRYDQNHYYTTHIAPDGSETRFARDGYGQLLSTTDPLGRITRYDYDPRGNLTRVVQPDGSTYTLRYGEVHRRPIVISDALGQSTEYEYDARGNLISIVDAAGAATRYVLDERGLIISILDARGGQSHLRYDSGGRPTERRDCLGQRTCYEYDEAGNTTAITDATGATTRFAYQRINRRDRLTVVTYADGSAERIAYDTLGRLVAHLDTAGRAVRYRLAPDGQPLARENELGHELRYQYDLHGRLAALTNENGAIYRFGWDSLDRLISERAFDGRRIDYRYNAAGELVESADGVPDRAGWLAPWCAGVLRTRYTRDPMGRMTEKVSVKLEGADRRSRIRFVYNVNGQLVEARNNQARIELHYTPVGLLAREVMRTRGGLTTTLEHNYDGLGNRYRTVLPDGSVLEQHLYGSGHIDRVTLDGAVVALFERDALQRETIRRQGALETFFERDSLGRLTRQTARRVDATAALAEPGIQRHYHYDQARRLRGIEDPRNGSSLYQYDNAGRLLAALGPAGEERFAFDPASNLLDTMAANPADSSPTEAARREWSESEWRDYVTAHLREAEFNPLQLPELADPDPAQWPDTRPNRLMVYQQHRYRYDRWGNCVEKRSGAHDVSTLHWNAEHQLERADVTRVEKGRLVRESWAYDYDPFGRRIAKRHLPGAEAANDAAQSSVGHEATKSLSRTTHFAWEGNRVLLERTGDRQTLYLYESNSFVPLALIRGTHTPAKPEETSALPLEWQSLKDRYPDRWAAIEQRRKKLDAQLGTVAGVDSIPPKLTEVFHVHTDHLGTPRELTDNDGNVVWSAVYRAWGATVRIDTPARREYAQDGNTARWLLREQTEPVVQNLRFQGQYFDAETGLHYNRFRHYDPDIGRFLSQDPIGLLGGSNPYRYASNPTEWVDPLGLKSCKQCLAECEKLLADQGVTTGRHGDLKKIGGLQDSHHIYQDAAMNGVQGYDYNDAIAISIQGRNPNGTTRGTPHYLANRAQDAAKTGGLLGSETVVAYKSLRAAGLSPEASKCAVLKARGYFSNLGASAGTSTQIPSKRKIP